MTIKRNKCEYLICHKNATHRCTMHYKKEQHKTLARYCKHHAVIVEEFLRM